MIDEYDAHSDSDILCLFQHVALSNKLSLILVILEVLFYWPFYFQTKSAIQNTIVYRADMCLCL